MRRMGPLLYSRLRPGRFPVDAVELATAVAAAKTDSARSPVFSAISKADGGFLSVVVVMRLLGLTTRAVDIAAAIHDGGDLRLFDLSLGRRQRIERRREKERGARNVWIRIGMLSRFSREIARPKWEQKWYHNLK